MSRRTGKVGGVNQKTANGTTEHVHTLLDDKADEAGLIVADRFQSKVLMSALVAINSGYVGQQTLELLQKLGDKSIDPFLNWGTLSQFEELHSLPESNG